MKSFSPLLFGVMSSVCMAAESDWVQAVKLTVTVSLRLERGMAKLQPGLELPVSQTDATTVELTFGGTIFTVEKTMTDFKRRLDSIPLAERNAAEKAFARGEVVTGMPRSMVVAIMGAPTEKHGSPGTAETLVYPVSENRPFDTSLEVSRGAGEPGKSWKEVPGPVEIINGVPVRFPNTQVPGFIGESVRVQTSGGKPVIVSSTVVIIQHNRVSSIRHEPAAAAVAKDGGGR